MLFPRRILVNPPEAFRGGNEGGLGVYFNIGGPPTGGFFFFSVILFCPMQIKTMWALTNDQLDQKHDPPCSTDHPLKLNDSTPIVTYLELQERAFKARCTLKDRAYKIYKLIKKTRGP